MLQQSSYSTCTHDRLLSQTLNAKLPPPTHGRRFVNEGLSDTMDLRMLGSTTKDFVALKPTGSEEGFGGNYIGTYSRGP